jgi:hypothetical protein
MTDDTRRDQADIGSCERGGDIFVYDIETLTTLGLHSSFRAWVVLAKNGAEHPRRRERLVRHRSGGRGEFAQISMEQGT